MYAQQLSKRFLPQSKQFKTIHNLPQNNHCQSNLCQNNFIQVQSNLSKNHYQNQRIFKISQELNKLDRLIQSTQIQSSQAANILKHCTNYSDDQHSNFSFDNQQQRKDQQCHNVAQFHSKQKNHKQNDLKMTPHLNLDDLQQHYSFDQDTIHMKSLKQGKAQQKKFKENKETQQKKYEKKKAQQTKKQIVNSMSKSQCSNLYLNNEKIMNQISDAIQDSLKLMENDRILSYSHHFQEEQESSQFHDMSSAIEISQIKAVDTTIKKAKQQKQKNSNKIMKEKQKSNHSQAKLCQNQTSHKKNKKIIGTAIGLAFDKPRILSNKEKEKIERIKSENKFINNQSNFGRGINLIKQKMKFQNESYLKKDRNQKLNTKQNSQLKEKQKSKIKLKKFMFASTSKSNAYQKNCNFSSVKGGEPLLSKRNVKYNSISKPVPTSNLQVLTFQPSQHNEKVIPKSKNQNLSKFHLNLQKQVTMKISDLKLKKNLCQIQTNYLSASVKITKQEIIKIFEMKEYSDERLLKHFIIKSLVKFISQYNDQNWEDQGIDLQNSTENQRIVQKTMKSPQKFIKVINKLPDILRRRNIVSQKRCKQFISQKVFTDQKIIQLNNNNGHKNGHNSINKDVLYIYMNQLHTYLQFLLNNNMIHQTKRSHIFNPSADVDGFFSDRSTKNAKKQDKNIHKYLESGNDSSSHNKIQQIQYQKQDHKQRKKEYDSQRKKEQSSQLKRVNTAKNLKKTTKTKLKK